MDEQDSSTKTELRQSIFSFVPVHLRRKSRHSKEPYRSTLKVILFMLSYSSSRTKSQVRTSLLTRSIVGKQSFYIFIKIVFQQNLCFPILFSYKILLSCFRLEYRREVILKQQKGEKLFSQALNFTEAEEHIGKFCLICPRGLGFLVRNEQDLPRTSWNKQGKVKF